MPNPSVFDLDQSTMAGNILATLGRATDAEITDGRVWYRAANTFAHGLTDAYPVSLEQACGIIAALSPRLGWGANMRGAEAICAGSRPGAVLPVNVAKAERIRDGEAPLDVLGGPKVRAFYANILLPVGRQGNGVTIDSHAVAIAFAEVLTKANPGPRVDRQKLYDHVVGAYVEAARETPFLPHELQAITWVAWRRIHSNPAQYDR